MPITTSQEAHAFMGHALELQVYGGDKRVWTWTQQGLSLGIVVTDWTPRSFWMMVAPLALCMVVASSGCLVR